jgi:Ca2+-binding RTX toxin-like protein
MPLSSATPKAAVPLDRGLLESLFGKLDPTLTKDSFDAFVARAGNDEASAIGNIFASLRSLLLDESGPVDPADVGAVYDRMIAAMDSGATGHVVSLASTTVDDLVKLAGSDVGALYALMSGQAFAVVGNDALYDQHNRDGSLFKFDPATGERNLSDEYLHARAQFLQAHLAAPSGTATLSGDQSWAFEDRAHTDSTGNALRIAASGSDPDLATHRMTFGDDAPAGENIAGGNTADQLFGGGGDDTMRGAAGDDYMEGGRGNDFLQGGRGDDTLVGGQGEDELDGGFGNDKLTGGVGADDLTGGQGDDRLEGGDGFDTYNIDAGDGNDTIVDSDGKGQVLLEGQAVTGGAVLDAGAWKSADGKLTFHFAGDAAEGGTLTIDVDGGQSMKIHQFVNGALGIKLGDGSAAALARADSPPRGGTGNPHTTDYGALLNVSDGGGSVGDGSDGGSASSSDAGSASSGDAGSAAAFSMPADGSFQPVSELAQVTALGPNYTKTSAVATTSPTENAITRLLEDPMSAIPFVTGEQVNYALRTADSRYFTGAAAQESAFGLAVPIAAADVTNALLDFHDGASDDALLGGDKPLDMSAVEQALAGFNATAPEEISARISTDLKPAAIGLGKVGLK